MGIEWGTGVLGYSLLISIEISSKVCHLGYYLHYEESIQGYTRKKAMEISKLAQMHRGLMVGEMVNEKFFHKITAGPQI